jgi:hypothetical protein
MNQLRSPGPRKTAATSSAVLLARLLDDPLLGQGGAEGRVFASTVHTQLCATVILAQVAGLYCLAAPVRQSPKTPCFALLGTDSAAMLQSVPTIRSKRAASLP